MHFSLTKEVQYRHSQNRKLSEMSESGNFSSFVMIRYSFFFPFPFPPLPSPSLNSLPFIPLLSPPLSSSFLFPFPLSLSFSLCLFPYLPPPFIESLMPKSILVLPVRQYNHVFVPNNFRLLIWPKSWRYL